MSNLKNKLARLSFAWVALALASCTAVSVNPSDVANIKKITVIELQVPEYHYRADGVDGVAKAVGMGAAVYGFGAIGGVIGSVAVAKMEQPYRDAIRDALAPHGPSFMTTFNNEIESALKARGIVTAWTKPPELLADGSGYDLAGAGFDSDYLIELLPVGVGFGYDDQASYPSVNVRWRLIRRYPGDKFIETNRGYVLYHKVGMPAATIPAVAQVAPVAEYRFPGPVNHLSKYGEAPAVAMRSIARDAARLTAQRALPVATQ